MPSPNSPPSLLGGQKQRGRAQAEPARPADPIRWYLVLEDRQVPARGGSVLLRAGKEISSSSYDMALLKRAGVKLREVETPQWFLDAQEDSRRRHAELTKAGVELGDHPPAYEPPAVAGDSYRVPAG